MREQGDFVDEVDLLEAEHRDLDGAIEDLDPESPEFDDRLAGLLRELSEHIDRENLGIFPVSVVSLAGRGWDLVEEARSALPPFMTGAPDTGPGAPRRFAASHIAPQSVRARDRIPPSQLPPPHPRCTGR